MLLLLLLLLLMLLILFALLAWWWWLLFMVVGGVEGSRGERQSRGGCSLWGFGGFQGMKASGIGSWSTGRVCNEQWLSIESMWRLAGSWVAFRVWSSLISAAPGLLYYSALSSALQSLPEFEFGLRVWSSLQEPDSAAAREARPSLCSSGLHVANGCLLPAMKVNRQTSCVWTQSRT